MRNSLIPANTLGSLDRGFGRLFDELFEGFGLIPTRGKMSAVPALDLVETDDAYRVVVDLPGVKEDDVHVSVEDGVLELRAEKRSEETKDGEELRYVERRSSSYARRMHLPGEVAVDGVDATLSDGVLTVVLPKTTKEEPRKIEVRRG